MTKRKGRASKGAIFKKPLLLSAVFLTMLSGVIYGSTFLGSNEATEQALLSGQRVEISLSSGEVFGGVDALNQNEAEAESPNPSDNNENRVDDLDLGEAAPTNSLQPDLVHSNQTEGHAVSKKTAEESQAVSAPIEPTYGPEMQSETLSEQGLAAESEVTPFIDVVEGEQQQQSLISEPQIEASASEIEQAAVPSNSNDLQEQVSIPKASASETPQELEGVIPTAADTQVKITMPADSEVVVDASEPVVIAKQPSATESQVFTREALESRRDDITLSGNKKPIVIIITGVGLSVRTTERVLEMPVNYSVGFSPYAPDVAVWNKKAIVLGFDTLMHMPMETPDYSVDDPGPYALISTATAEENVSRLEMLLSLGVGYKGVYSSPNESFSSNMNNMRPVIAGLAQMQMPYLYGKGAGNVSLLQFAEQSNIKLVVNDVTLDDTISYEAIKSQLELLEKMASENEFAVGIARPYPLTLETLKFWQKSLEQKNFEVVPFSMLIDRLAKKGP